MWEEESCPPSDASRLPGKPAVSQFEQMSMSIIVQSTQWKRAPTMSCRQLYLYQRKDIEVFERIYPLEASDAGVFERLMKGDWGWASADMKSRVATHMAHPHCRKLHRHLVLPSDCAVAKEASLSVLRKGEWDGRCEHRCIRYSQMLERQGF